MGKDRQRALIALNLGLLAILALVSLVPQAGAQNQPAARARGQYTMVAGDLRFGTGSGIWILDSVNEELVAIRWNDARRQLEGISFRNLTADRRAQPGR